MGDRFAADLADGDLFEKHCINLLGLEGHEAHKSSDLSWDLQFNYNGRLFTVECKLDKLSTTTKNFYFETTYRGNPSGIAKSQAHFWMQGENDVRVILYRRQALWDFLKGGDFQTVGGGGDNAYSGGILMPTKLALQVPFTREYF